MHMTSFEEFKELAQRGTFVPVYKEIVADMLTPVSAFLKVAEHSDYAFLLESVEGGEQVGRRSFLGKDPFLILRSRAGKTIVDRMGEATESDKPFIASVRELMADSTRHLCPASRASRVVPSDTLPTTPRPGSSPSRCRQPPTQTRKPVSCSSIPCSLDHVRHRILIIANARITGDEDLESLYQFACTKIEFVERELERMLSRSPQSTPRSSTSPRTSAASSSSRWCALRRSTSRWRHLSGRPVAAVRASIATDPFTVYRALRHVNPSPYMYFLRIGGRSIVGSSPEMLGGSKVGASRRIRSPAHAHEDATTKRICVWPRN